MTEEDQKIRLRLLSLGGLLVLAIVGLFGTYWVGTSKQHAYDLRLSELTAARSQTKDVSARLQDMVTQEKQFLLRQSPEDLSALQVSQDSLLEQSQALLSTPLVLAGDDIFNNVSDHIGHMKDVIERKLILGLSEDFGLEGALRDAIHGIETQLEQLGDERLQVNMLTLRRHEKDFMMRGDIEYVDQFTNQVASFRQSLKTSALAAVQRADLIERLSVYEDTFLSWSSIKSQMDRSLAAADMSLAFLSAVTAAADTDMAAQLAAAQDKRAALQKDMQLILWLFGGVALVCVVALIIVFTYNQEFADLLEQRQRLKEMAAENQNLANVDSLTELPNRRSFFAELDALVAQRMDCNTPFSVGVMDLDGFKRVNDVYGHPAGDQLLVKAGKRMRETLPDDVLLTRLGGDEFGLLIPNPGSDTELLALGTSICYVLREEFELDEGTVSVAGTIGFSRYPDAGETSDALFETADYALYHAKQNNKGTPLIFSKKHEEHIRWNAQVEHQLQQADLESELYVLFQPIYDTNTGEVQGFEALARWQNETLGAVQPNDFIPAAERAGMMHVLTPILLNKAMAEAQSWPEQLSLSFNLSVLDLASPEVMDVVVEIVSLSALAPQRVVFEVTETAIVSCIATAKLALDKLREMGAKIALDDFGTGYSSLNYLSEMPVDRVKIDRAFVEGIETEVALRNVVNTIADLCRNLDLECVVEGVETQTQLDSVNGFGLNLVQGYLFSRPVPAGDIGGLLEPKSDKLIA